MKKYPNDLIGDIMKAFGKYADRPAFVIEDTACTYGELATAYRKYPPYSRTEKTKLSASSQKTDWKHTHPYYLH